jgi:hypothetical protein
MSERIQFGERPAFPVSIPGWGDNGASGITSRDFFAAAALVAWGSGRNQPMIENTSSSPEIVAAGCYRYADAMLAARENRS